MMIRGSLDGDLEVLEAALAAGACPDAKGENSGRPALHCACSEGESACAARLLAAGASLELCDDSGWTALMWAASEGHVKSARELLQAGADADRRTGIGQTPAMLAVLRGHRELARELEDERGDMRITRRRLL